MWTFRRQRKKVSSLYKPLLLYFFLPATVLTISIQESQINSLVLLTISLFHLNHIQSYLPSVKKSIKHKLKLYLFFISTTGTFGRRNDPWTSWFYVEKVLEIVRSVPVLTDEGQ